MTRRTAALIVALGLVPLTAPAPREAPPPQRTLDPTNEALRAQIVELLTNHRGNVSEISRVMGKTRMQIHRWMKRFGLDPEQYRG